MVSEFVGEAWRHERVACFGMGTGGQCALGWRWVRWTRADALDATASSAPPSGACTLGKMVVIPAPSRERSPRRLDGHPLLSQRGAYYVISRASATSQMRVWLIDARIAPVDAPAPPQHAQACQTPEERGTIEPCPTLRSLLSQQYMYEL
ncbi:hypothetical protein FA95DRAFT_1554459 [Auriscalpium vulgare]|uniref:Uncharacterized protein n=1 Tax=Auriscalpium vulgare TaxID=40419 RepID=A0ACB8S533_9AGAM|nr:hypothetical protein FA95DRAFT_1554459 [Auriscalpium vulgare]